MQTQPRTKAINPHFADEATTKHNIITCLIDHYKANNIIKDEIDEFNMICDLQALPYDQLSNQLGEIIVHIEQDLVKKYKLM